jgi:choline kinase
MSATEAVILAAGRGSRLSEKTGEIPKALLPIGPRTKSDPTETTFLRRQIEALRGLGVERICVVVGWLRQPIIEALAEWKVAVDVVVNPTPEIQTSGSLHSFQFAVRSGKGYLDGTRSTLLCDADIVYDRRALQRLLEAPAGSALLVSGAGQDNSEAVRVYGPTERPRFLGKGLDADTACGEPCLGEAVGIVRFAPVDHPLARKTIDWMLGDPSAKEGTLEHKGFGPARRATEHEELTQRFMHYGRMRAVVFGAELGFMEVDDADEYRTLRTDLYPRILEEEARLGHR